MAEWFTFPMKDEKLNSETLLASLVVLGLLINLARTKKLARQQGFDITVSGWQYG
jgi:hypothetical protein